MTNFDYNELFEDTDLQDVEALNSVPIIDMADFIENAEVDRRLAIFTSLNDERAVKVFEYLPLKIQQEILQDLPKERTANLLNLMSPDDRTNLLDELPEPLRDYFLSHLSPEEHALTAKLLSYPENSVGRLMTPDYLAIKLNWTVQEALDFIRKNGKDSETLNIIYAVDHKGVLVDDFRIRELLLAPLHLQIKDIADHKIVTLNATDNVEQVIPIFRKYDRVALPVVDENHVLLGIVTMDDIIDVAVKEDTEDMQKIGGVQALNEPYMDIPLHSLLQKRIGWLTLLFVGELFTASAMSFYEEEISKAVVLALFLPLIISSGGNAGSQASTLIVRAMALGEVSLKDWWIIMRREILSGFFLGGTLGLIGFGRVVIWGSYTHVYGDNWLLIAFTILFSLIGVVLWGTLSGSMLPMLLKRAGFDPAVSSAPFVATLVDVTGIVIYFSCALIFLKGSLL